MHKFFIQIFGHLGLKKTNIPARYGDESFSLSNCRISPCIITTHAYIVVGLYAREEDSLSRRVLVRQS